MGGFQIRPYRSLVIQVQQGGYNDTADAAKWGPVGGEPVEPPTGFVASGYALTLTLSRREREFALWPHTSPLREERNIPATVPALVVGGRAGGFAGRGFDELVQCAAGADLLVPTADAEVDHQAVGALVLAVGAAAAGAFGGPMILDG